MDESTPPTAVPPPDEIPAARPVPAEAIEYPTAVPVLPPGAEPPPVMPAPPFQDVRTSWAVVKYIVFGVIAIAGYVTLLAIPGETRAFAGDGLEVIPFAGLALLAYTADRYEAGRLLTVLYWIFLVGLVGLVFLGLSFMLAVDPAHFHNVKAGRPASGSLFLPDGARAFGLCFLGTGLAGLCGLLGFLVPVRRLAARLIPIDAASFVHATALATVLAVTLISFVPLVAFGKPPFLGLLEQFADMPGMAELGERDLRIDQAYAFAWMLPSAIVAVGYPVVRNFRGALNRLGFVRPTVGQVVFAVFAGAMFVGLMSVINLKIGDVWKLMGWPETSEKEFGQFMKSAINPIGAIVIGATAGLGEELIFRGVIQPRMGILLANLLFTAMHAAQYNFDALLSVFIVGLLLGVVRKYSNTTTSAIIHGLYDFILILMAYKDFSLEMWLRQHAGM
jgi:membrane protease YdiL (CAAX protease family)